MVCWDSGCLWLEFCESPCRGEVTDCCEERAEGEKGGGGRKAEGERGDLGLTGGAGRGKGKEGWNFGYEGIGTAGAGRGEEVWDGG